MRAVFERSWSRILPRSLFARAKFGETATNTARNFFLFCIERAARSAESFLD